MIGSYFSIPIIDNTRLRSSYTLHFMSLELNIRVELLRSLDLQLVATYDVHNGAIHKARRSIVDDLIRFRQTLGDYQF